MSAQPCDPAQNLRRQKRKRVYRQERHPSCFPNVGRCEAICAHPMGWVAFVSLPTGKTRYRPLCAPLRRGANCTSVYKEKRWQKLVDFLITLAAAHSYSRQPVIWYVADKEAEKMRKTLEDFYYGNITPCEQQMTPGSDLKRAVDRVAHYESQLMEQLGESEQAILTKLIRSQREINSITARENFILGFRLGVRMMAECLNDNDGDIQNGGG